MGNSKFQVIFVAPVVQAIAITGLATASIFGAAQIDGGSATHAAVSLAIAAVLAWVLWLTARSDVSDALDSMGQSGDVRGDRTTSSVRF
jgi:hypothetical protein